MIAIFYFAFGCMSKQSDSASADELVDVIDDTGAVNDDDTGAVIDDDTGDVIDDDSGTEVEEEECSLTYSPYPFIHEVISYTPGEGAGFGQDQYPQIIEGPPTGMGDNAGSLDVLSLGEGGEIIFTFDGLDIVDEEGPDIIIFENSFIGWTEPGIVSVSMDGVSWVEWPCDLDTQEGCAGVQTVQSHPDNCIDARDASVSGGDAFDLATIGLSEARFVRIQDAAISGPGGFDLDAAVVVHHQEQ